VNLTAEGLIGGERKYLKELLPRLRRHPAIDGLRVWLPPGVDSIDAVPHAMTLNVE
jgi:hypothetical protein